MLCISCRVRYQTLNIQDATVSFLDSNASSLGGFKFKLANSDTTKSIVRTVTSLDKYSPIKNPILITISKKDNCVMLSNLNGSCFQLGKTVADGESCNYDCPLIFDSMDKISLTSNLGLFSYWHGISSLGGLPLFMRYHYYTLKIKKESGQTLLLEWKYSIHKYKPSNGKSKVWSTDYCEDNGGGLTKLKIK